MALQNKQILDNVLDGVESDLVKDRLKATTRPAEEQQRHVVGHQSCFGNVKNQRAAHSHAGSSLQVGLPVSWPVKLKTLADASACGRPA